MAEWGVRVTRAELFKLLPFGLAGRAHIEGEWFDRILWARKRAGHTSTVPVERSGIFRLARVAC